MRNFTPFINAWNAPPKSDGYPIAQRKGLFVKWGQKNAKELEGAKINSLERDKD